MLLNCGVGEDSWESPGLQGEQTVHPKGNQSWIFIGRTDAEAETSILWPPDAKNWLIWKNPYAGKDWKQKEKGTTEDEMVGWHHWLMTWTWVWVNFGNWWWTGRPGMLQSMGLQSRTQLSNWTNLIFEMKWSINQFLNRNYWIQLFLWQILNTFFCKPWLNIFPALYMSE